MDFSSLAAYIKTEDFNNCFGNIINHDTLDALRCTDAADIEKMLGRIFTDTVFAENKAEWELYRVYYIIAWYNCFKVLNLPVDTTVYEIAAGDSIYVPQALEAFTVGRGKYVTLNLNRELTRNFISKTAELNIGVRVIEDNGINILNYYNEGTFDVIAFQHAINDIIQTIVCEIDGIDTQNNNWWETEPLMLRAVYTHYKAGTLKEVAYNAFISIISVCCRSLKKDGYMIFDNCTFKATYDESVYSMDFHSNYINMAREWIAEADLGLEEINLDGYKDKWWMILRKK